MRAEEIFAELSSIIRDAFGRADMVVAASTSAAEVPGWDSFKMIEILMAVEERFGVVMETHDMDNVNNVGDLLTRICDKLKYGGRS
jgi:acyl carrier protein